MSLKCQKYNIYTHTFFHGDDGEKCFIDFVLKNKVQKVQPEL